MFTEIPIDTAWQRFCYSRRDFLANAGIWYLQFHNHRLLPQIMDDVRTGNYHERPLGISRLPAESHAGWFPSLRTGPQFCSRKGMLYLGFINNLLILAHTCWQLKRAIAIMTHWFSQAGLEQHPDKTFIGLLIQGFDWRDYHSTP